MGLFDKIKEKIKEHTEDSTYNKTIIVTLNGATKKEPSKYDLLSSEDKKLCNAFDDKYYYAAQRWYEKYTDTVGDITHGFYDIFDYKKRITALEKMIKAYDDFFKKFSKNGRGGEIFFELEFPEVNTKYTPTSFCKEYSLDSENVNCYKWLLQYYTEHQEEVCQIIKDEYIESEYGSYEAYEETVRYENHIKELKTKIVSLIKKNDGILQKNIYKEFDPDDINFVKRYLKELTDTSKITRTKSGNTYSLHYNTSSNK